MTAREPERTATAAELAAAIGAELAKLDRAVPAPSLADLARQLVESFDQDPAAALARPDWARLAVAVLREVSRG